MASAQQQWASQAAINALLRTQPQREGLADLQRAAQEKFAGSVAAAKSEGALGKQAATAAVAPTQQIFSSAAAQGARGAALSSPVLAALSADSPFKAAAANEQSAGAERRANTEAAALSRLQQEQVSAANLPAYGRQAALAELAKELGGITSKKQALAATEGADIASETGKEEAEAHKLAQSERQSQRSAATARGDSERSTSASRENSERSAATSERNSERSTNTSRANAEEKAAAKGLPAGVKPLSTTAQNASKATIEQIQQLAGALYGEHHSRAEVVQALTAPSVKTASGAKTPSFKPDTRLRAALDLAEDGHLSRKVEGELKNEGYNLKALGFPKAPPLPKTPGGIGKQIQKAVSGF